MSMKKILMAAAAVTALTAGSANALTLANTSTIGGVALAIPTGATSGYEAYSVASEFVATSTTSAGAVITVNPTAGVTIPAGTYVVTWTVSGGTFDVSGTITPLSVGGTASNVISTTSATSIVVSYTNSANVTSWQLTAPILVGTSKSPVTISASVTTQGGTAVDGGSVGPITVLDYRSGFAFAASPANLTLALVDGFKKFGTSATSSSNTTSGDLATAVGIIANNGYAADGTTLTTDRIWSDFAGTALNPTTLISGVTLKLGGDLSAFKFTSGTANADAGAPDTITAGGTPLANLRQNITSGSYVAQSGAVGLAQLSTPVAGVESAYNITPTVTMATPASWTTPTFAARAVGSVTYQGTTFYAPWFGDGSNGINYTIRLSNAGTAAIPFAQIKLGSPFVSGTSGSVAGTATCSVGTIPAKGELLITSAMAQACFGNFKRGDLTIITGKSSTAGTTAKMRATAINGTVSEVSLGTSSVNPSSSTTPSIYN